MIDVKFPAPLACVRCGHTDDVYHSPDGELPKEGDIIACDECDLESVVEPDGLRDLG